MIYVLECQEGKYYVGRSADTRARIAKHFGGHGCAWTRQHPPLRVVVALAGETLDDEDAVTLAFMDAYGIANVRGGRWSQPAMSARGQARLRRLG